MDLRQIEYFLAVVDHGGVTRAAWAIRVAQPSVSQALRAMERDLGVELFHRTGRGVVLTPAGRALVEPARQVLADASTARAAVVDVAGLAAGRLDVAAHAALMMDPLLPAVVELRRRYPGVAVRILEPRDDEDTARLLRSGRCELALAYLPVPDAVLPPDADVPDGPLPLKALDGVPIIGVHGPGALRTVVVSALRDAGAAMPRGVVTRHREAVVPMVMAGAGAAFVTRWYADEAARRGAVVRSLDPPLGCAYALLRPSGRLSPAAQVLVGLLEPDS